VGQAAATARTGSTSAVVAVVLLTVLLGLVAYLMRQGRDAQTQTELLLAQLADARDAQAEAAVVAERGRIAAELHDVLAHALSGAALQLQGARLLADRAQPDPRLVEAIERAARLVADGLVNARRAVRTLRGAELPSLTQLDQLVADARRDLCLDITLKVNGTPTPLPPEQALALYRGVEEALTNAARHAPGAAVRVEVEYRPADTTIQVQNTPPTPAPIGTSEYPNPDLARLGGGNGLAGLHERLQHLGGSVDAGPHEGGWRVRLIVPTPRPTIPTRSVGITTPAGPVIPR
jgi:signal transduction histidine kinase